MEIYIFILCLLLLTNSLRACKEKKILVLFIFILMLFVCGMRGINVGMDTYNYVTRYRLNNFSVRVEPMYSFLAWICRSLFFSPKSFIMTYAIVTYIPFYIFLRRTSCNMAFSLLIFLSFSVYFYHQTFNTIRAYMAIMYMLFAYYYLNQKRYVLVSVFLVIGVLCHYSALSAIPFILLAKIIKRLDFWLVILMMVVSGYIGFTMSPKFVDIGNQIGLLFEVYKNPVADTYAFHFDIMRESGWNVIGRLTNIIPFSLFVILIYDKKQAESVYYKLFFFAVVLSNCLVSIELTYRITQYFLILLVVLLPNAFHRARGMKRISLLLLSGMMIMLYIYQMLKAEPYLGFAGTIPYSI